MKKTVKNRMYVLIFFTVVLLGSNSISLSVAEDGYEENDYYHSEADNQVTHVDPYNSPYGVYEWMELWDADYFAVSVNAGDQLEVKLETNAGIGNFCLVDIHPSNGSEIRRDCGGTDNQLVLDFIATTQQETYIILVNGSIGGYYYNLTFSTSEGSVGVDDGYEENDRMEDAPFLGNVPINPLNLKLLDEDWFRFHCNDDLVTVKIQIPSNDNMEVKLYSSDGGYIETYGKDASKDFIQFDISNANGKDYYISITGNYGVDLGYSLEVTNENNGGSDGNDGGSDLPFELDGFPWEITFLGVGIMSIIISSRIKKKF